jgi:hypothetical protein
MIAQATLVGCDQAMFVQLVDRRRVLFLAVKLSFRYRTVVGDTLEDDAESSL